jgi:hypothetical protein
MNLDRLKFVKNIDDPERWAYKDWQRHSQQQLHWSNAKGNVANADKANIDDLILLVQKSPHSQETHLTHLVKVISASAETISEGDWSVIREVAVIWVADFTHPASIPTDKDVFGWKRHRPQGTKIVQLENLKDNQVIQLWHSLEIFQRHVAGILGITEE